MRDVVCAGPVHLLVPKEKQVRSAATVVIERSKRLPKPAMRSGFPVAHLARAALDAARRMDSIDRVRATLTEVVQHGRVELGVLRHELDRGSNRGSALPRRVLTEISDGIRSTAEAWARDLVRRARLPTPRYNARVHTTDGALLGIVDAWWDDVCLGWEIDSVGFHFRAADYGATMTRHNAFTAAGAIMVHTVPSALRRDPRGVVADLRGAYEHARSRPRPSLVVKDS